ncbi:GMC family oxidoreductase [Corynebacterium neomassiliense]|uniref:GMC family oxidoreductase n=1 Tax=Corynebacterium neomassiliense TaxID=2079482 RepID=UPI0010304AAC|nr:GMC family oxidoreductase [Corynebacterium neomassiliense]
MSSENSTAPAGDAPTGPYDHIIVGGGTAGCIVAARLASRADRPRVALVERGPEDTHEPLAQAIRNWDRMVDSRYAVQHRSVPQARGNSHIDHTRLHILGGCSTANTMISWRPFRGDLQEWEARGAVGWGPDQFLPYYDRLRTAISVIPLYDRSARLQRVLTSAATALDIPEVVEWNGTLPDTRSEYHPGAGFFEIGYIPETNQRSSSSNAYRDLLTRAGLRGNLDLLTGHRTEKLLLSTTGDTVCTGVRVTGPSGTARDLRLADGGEVIMCAGAYETPRLLMASGVGDPEVLSAAGVETLVDLPGVGRNLQDHAEGIVVWETRGPAGPESATGWDAGYLWGNAHARGEYSDLDPVPSVTTHVPVEAWVEQLVRAGVDLPEHYAGAAPNVSRPASRGRVWITSPDQDAELQIDYGYFTDEDGLDEKALVDGVRNARRVAAEEPFASEIVREVFPGPDVTSDEDISAAERAVHQTVYHPCGTCAIGADSDPGAVLDPQLRVRGVAGLRVADASAMPTVTSTNPVVTIMMIAERAADLVSGK